MNYLGHFGLREAPFSITPDTSFFYACRSSQAALNTLLVALSNGEGFLKITGEVGTGKTLVCRKFISIVEDEWLTAYIPNPHMEPRALLLALAEELGVPVDSGVDQHHLMRGITKALLDNARAGRRAVLCMDEAQAMPLETLETVRLLTNLETEKRKLLQVILFGQPELDRKLDSESIRQLRQRITFQHHLKGMDRSEVAAYLAHRLAIAGYTGDRLFSPGATGLLHKASDGMPRLVNILAHKAMLSVFGEGRHRVERRDVRIAAEDTPAVAPLRPWWWPRLRPARAVE
ncbi:MAG TPA: AAA family ATPase [Burkholderiales bacterium]|jgi:MSHA biogenesis protein MshM|nr:AAA family ATPase [Burkholderiales bacterium]